MSKKVVIKDTTIKILSIIFAILLWFYVITEQNPVVPKEITIPVKITSIEALDKYDMILLDDSNSFSINLKLKGKKEILDTVNANSINAYADISGYRKQGENYVPVVISGIPEGISVTSKTNQTVKINIDKKMISQRTVTAKITGNPVAGLAYMTPELTPSEVVLTGAESLINKIKTITVEIDIAGASNNVIKRLPVRLLDEAGKDVSGVQINPQFINVTVPIANTKRIPINLVLEGSAGEGYIISEQSVQPKEILVTGDQQVLDSLTTINTITLKVNNLVEDTELEVKLDLPPGVKMVNENEEIKAVLDIQRVITNTIEISKIEYRNLSLRYKLEEDPSRNIVVKLRGAEDIINQAAENIVLYVDLRNAKEGIDSYEILWDKTSKFEILEVLPQQISIDIRKIE
ncbi:MAG: CdaR family protein [Lutisporaceae bacterium]